MKKTIFKTAVLIAVAPMILISCGNNESKKDVAEVADNQPHGIILENMDTSVNPKDDFYNYVNGSWMKNTEIPGG